MRSLKDILNDIKNDRISGGKKLGYKAILYVENLYDKILEDALSKEAVISLLNDLRMCRPYMGIVYNVGDLLIKTLRKNGDWIKNYKITMDNIKMLLDNSDIEIKSKLKNLLSDRVSVATLSYSSNVRMFIEYNKDLIKEVYLLESRPGEEIKYAYKNCLDLGLSVKVYPDSAINYVVRKGTIVVVGIDAITIINPHLIHKVGTNPLLTVAHYKGIDTYVIGEALKIIDADANKIVIDKWQYRVEALDNEINVYPFDKTPIKYIKYLITDLRVIKDICERDLSELYIKLLFNVYN